MLFIAKVLGLFLGLWALIRGALVFGGEEFSASITLVDYGGQRDSINLNVVAADAAAADAAIQDIATKLRQITSCQIESVNYQKTYTSVTDDSIGVTNPAAIYGAEREHRGVLATKLDDDRSYKITFPGPAEAVLQASDKDLLNPENAELTAFINLFKAGGSLTVGNSGAVVTSVERAYTQHRESRVKSERTKIG